MSRVRRHLRANVVGYVALFVALSLGTAWAATLPKNSVTAKQIKANAVRSAEVRDYSLLGKDFAQGELPRGEQGPPGPQGPQGPAGSPDSPQQVREKLVQVDGSGSGVDADTLDGQGASGFASATVENWTNVTYCPADPSTPGSNWQTYAPWNASVGYYKDPWGVVHLRGTIDGGVDWLSPFVLPDGYQPPHHSRFTVPTGLSATAVGSVLIDAGGVVYPPVSNGPVSFDGVTFKAAPADGVTSPCWVT